MINGVTLYQVAFSGIAPVASKLSAMLAYGEQQVEGEFCSNPDGYVHCHDYTDTGFLTDCIYASTGVHQYSNYPLNPTLWESSGLDPAALASTAAAVNSVTGTVMDIDSGGSHALTTLNGVVAGDRLTTATASTVAITMPDGTAVSLLPNSVLDIVAASFSPGSPANDAYLILQEGVANFVTGLERTGRFMIETVTGTGGVTLNDGTHIGFLPGSVLNMAEEIYIGPNSPANSALMVVQDGAAQFVTVVGEVGSFVVQTLRGTGDIQLPSGSVSLLPNSTLDLVAAGFAPGTPGGDAVMIMQDGAAQFVNGLKQTGSYAVKIGSDAVTATLRPGGVLDVAKALYVGEGSLANNIVTSVREGVVDFVTGLQRTGSFIVETATGTVRPR